MTREEQEEFVRDLMDNVKDSILSRKDNWDLEWSGHELRLLIAKAVDSEVTHIMRDRRKPKVREFESAWKTKNLYP